jgi:hypothetical protein
MPVAALKPTTASSGTIGAKRSAPIGGEPAPKRACVSSVTRVFAADKNRGQSGWDRKGARSKNSAMRDLLTQSRDAIMIPCGASGSISSKGGSARSVTRIGSTTSNMLASRSSRTSPGSGKMTTKMKIDRGGIFPPIDDGPPASRVRT